MQRTATRALLEIHSSSSSSPGAGGICVVSGSCLSTKQRTCAIGYFRTGHVDPLAQLVAPPALLSTHSYKRKKMCSLLSLFDDASLTRRLAFAGDSDPNLLTHVAHAFTATQSAATYRHRQPPPLRNRSQPLLLSYAAWPRRSRGSQDVDTSGHPCVHHTCARAAPPAALCAAPRLSLAMHPT